MTFEGINYIVSTPPEFDTDKEYPVVIFMHGAGTRGDDLEKVKSNPFFNDKNILLKNAIVYAPQCGSDTWFDMFESVRRFAQFVYEAKNTDKNRLYLVGASMGGYAVWQMMLSDPHLYAGAIPICGGGMYWNSARLKDINIWAFHGKNDPVVFCDESVKMVEGINNYGGSAKITLFDDCGHDSWTYVYTNPEPFFWLLKCRKGQICEFKSEYTSSEQFG